MLKASYSCLLTVITQSLTMASISGNQMLPRAEILCFREILQQVKDKVTGSLVWLSHWAMSYESYFMGSPS